MLWIALAPFMLLGLAVACVPVMLGMVHDHRARRAREEQSPRFFLPKDRSERSAAA